MSALGQKQTCAAQEAMSALPPIATAKADIGKPSGLLYPQKRTCAAHYPMSALGQKRTRAVQQRYLADACRLNPSPLRGRTVLLCFLNVENLGGRHDYFDNAALCALRNRGRFVAIVFG